MDLFHQALTFATAVHAGQTRRYNGQPYIYHPIRVSQMVINHPISSEITLCAALLHDTLEDRPDIVTYEGLSQAFGPDVARLVKELTNYSKLTSSTASRAERKQMDRDNLSRASKEAQIIKSFDRVDNLQELIKDIQTGQNVPKSFAQLYLGESWQLYQVIEKQLTSFDLVRVMTELGEVLNG